MKINSRISDSISEYTCHTDKSQIIKILINPLEYLEGLKNSNHFSITNKFIYTENHLYQYMNYIKDIFIQGYYNYYNCPNSLNFVLYRAMSEIEFSNLLNNGNVNTLYSTFSSFAQARNYILDNYEDVFKDNHYIVEFSLSDVLPFINVSVDSSNCYERGEIILLPSFNISNLELTEYQHYYHTIHEAKAHITPISIDNYNIQNIDTKLNELYLDISEDIYKYGVLIDKYLNNDSDLKENMDLINWLKKISLYVKYLAYKEENIIKKSSDNKVLMKMI